MAKKSKIEEIVEPTREFLQENVEQSEIVSGTFKLVSGHIKTGLVKDNFLHANDGTVNSLEGAKPFNK